MEAKKGKILSKDMSSLFVGPSGGKLTMSLNSLHASRKLLLTKFGSGSVLTKLARVGMVLDVALPDIQARKVALRRNVATISATSSHRTLVTYGPLGSGVRSFSFDDASVLSIMLM